MGCTFARVVADALPTVRVLVVDAGPQLTEPPGVNLKNVGESAVRRAAQKASEGPDLLASHAAPAEEETTAVQMLARGTTRLARPGTHLVDGDAGGLPAAAMSTNVGGMGAHWTCAAPRPGGSERIDFVDLDEAFETAERLLGVRTRVLPPSRLGEWLHAALASVFDPLLAGGRPVQPMPLACRPGSGGTPIWGGTDTVLGRLASEPASTFDLRADTICRGLLLDDDVVTGAMLEHLPSGITERVDVRAVVVAADALRTPQLLWASGVRPYALGRYLNDQPQIVSAVRLSGGVAAAGAEASLDAQPVAAGVWWVPFSDVGHPYHGQVMHFDLSAVTPDDPTLRAADVVALSWYCRKEPRAEDRVEFRDDRADVFGMPRMVLRYELTHADRAAIAEASDLQARAVSVLGDRPPDHRPRLLPPGSSLHYQGTVRMGRADDGASVCDPDSRVWGTRNLFVGGNGVIPTATACNPTLTSVALAVRASRAVADLLA